MTDLGLIGILRAVRDAGGIGRTPKAVLLGLACFANAEGECWPSTCRLAVASGLTERAVRSGLAALISAGLVGTPGGRSGGRGRATRYRIEVEALASLATKGAPDSAFAAESPARDDVKPGTARAERRNGTTEKGARPAPQETERNKEEANEGPPARMRWRRPDSEEERRA